MARSINEIQAHIDSVDWKQRAHAADDLGELRDPKGLPLLISALQDESQFVRMAAARSLGRLGDKKAVPTLLEALSDPIFMVRQNAMWALGEIGDPAALSALEPWVNDPTMFSERAITVGQLAQIAIQRIQLKGSAQAQVTAAGESGAPTRAKQPTAGAAPAGDYQAISDEDKERKRQEALARKAARTGGTPPPQLSEEELEKRRQEALARKAARESAAPVSASVSTVDDVEDVAPTPAKTAAAAAPASSGTYQAISDEDKERKKQEALARKAARAGGAPPPVAAAPAAKPAAPAPAPVAAETAVPPTPPPAPAAAAPSAPPAASDSGYVPLSAEEKERKKQEALARKAARQKGEG